jgi:hypothetical protein
MAVKIVRNGGKFNGSHTTLTATAAEIADIANASPEVYKISIGIIESGLRAVAGQKRLKIQIDGHHILLKVRGNINHQELYIYSRNIPEAIDFIAKKAEEKSFLVQKP